MRAVLRYAARYRSRYLIGFACLAAGTGFYVNTANGNSNSSSQTESRTPLADGLLG